jgi:hypothetical protein
MKNPTAAGGVVDKLAGEFRDRSTLSHLRVQHLISRYAVPVEHAATIAALAFSGVSHG